MKQRGLALATWYVEKGRFFGLDGDIFALAAITTTAQQPDGADLLTYSIVTRETAGVAAETHPRMPMIVPRKLHGRWLRPGISGDSQLIADVLAASDKLSTQIERIDPPSQPASFSPALF